MSNNQKFSSFQGKSDSSNVACDSPLDCDHSAARSPRSGRTMDALTRAAGTQPSERRFRDMIDALPTAIYTSDAEGRLTHFNPAAVELSGRMPKLGSDQWCISWKLYRPDGTPLPHDQCPMAVALKEKRPVRGEVIIAERPNGQRVWVEPYPTPLFDEDGNLIGGINMLIDITEKKEAMQALEKARQQAEAANHAKDHFLAVLSHELRTPLAPVVMAIAAMDMNPDLPPAVRNDIAMIKRNVELEARLIDDLLDLSRVTAGKLRLNLEAVDVNSAVRHVCETCRPYILEKAIHLRCELPDRAYYVKADAARLQQVLWNLLRNAAKFTPEGGDIFVGVRTTEGNRLQIEIRDTGIGMASNVLPRIFDAFQQGDTHITRQFGGMGLGLAISKALVEIHGGSIRALSDGLHKGSTFVVEMPILSDENVSLPHSPALDRKHIGTQIRVLLVEDHPDTIAVLSRMLCSCGYQVKTATTAAAALDLAAKESFDVVVSDIGLPDATGYQLMKEIKSRYAMKGIAMSGYGMEEDLLRSRDAGFSDHIVKPANVAQLERSIRRVAAEA
jgi:PAS domain S-box-containing protein